MVAGRVGRSYRVIVFLGRLAAKHIATSFLMYSVKEASSFMKDIFRTRRDFLVCTAAATGSHVLWPHAMAAAGGQFKFKYLVGSCMYGYTKLAELLPEVAKAGATAVDIWPKPHGDQCEQLDAMGEDQFRRMLKTHDITLGCITQYKLGPFGLTEQMGRAKRLGCQTIVTGGKGPVGLSGGELKLAVKSFIEKMKPHLDVAAESGVTIAIENHANNLIDSTDAMKWLAELRPSKNLAIALAPYHLPQDENMLAQLITELGESIAVFYAWQHGMGCMKKLPKPQELLQMPGRGSLDFAPIVAALRKIQYNGWTEIFMHPFPRGVPILGSTSAVTEEINRSRKYLEDLAIRS